jgi:hypothetical protein
LERLVRQHLSAQESPAQKASAKLPHILDLESKLRRQLGTRVAIETRRNGQRGRIVIEFDSVDHFDRITEILGLTCRDDT